MLEADLSDFWVINCAECGDTLAYLETVPLASDRFYCEDCAIAMKLAEDEDDEETEEGEKEGDKK